MQPAYRSEWLAAFMYLPACATLRIMRFGCGCSAARHESLRLSLRHTEVGGRFVEKANKLGDELVISPPSINIAFLHYISNFQAAHAHYVYRV